MHRIAQHHRTDVLTLASKVKILRIEAIVIRGALVSKVSSNIVDEDLPNAQSIVECSTVLQRGDS